MTFNASIEQLLADFPVFSSSSCPSFLGLLLLLLGSAEINRNVRLTVKGTSSCAGPP